MTSSYIILIIGDKRSKLDGLVSGSQLYEFDGFGKGAGTQEVTG